jgi:hypothetical protein
MGVIYRARQRHSRRIVALKRSPAQFLAVCWIVHVEFKLHRLRDGFSVSNVLLLGQSHPAFIGHSINRQGYRGRQHLS